jgi:hypothetical protein
MLFLTCAGCCCAWNALWGLLTQSSKCPVLQGAPVVQWLSLSRFWTRTSFEPYLYWACTILPLAYISSFLSLPHVPWFHDLPRHTVPWHLTGSETYLRVVNTGTFTTLTGWSPKLRQLWFRGWLSSLLQRPKPRGQFTKHRSIRIWQTPWGTSSSRHRRGTSLLIGIRRFKYLNSW